MSAGKPGSGRRRHQPPRQVKCPQCGQPTAYEGNPWRPFCSERCKLIDLGAWADERYAIPSQDTPGQEDEE